MEWVRCWGTDDSESESEDGRSQSGPVFDNVFPTRKTKSNATMQNLKASYTPIVERQVSAPVSAAPGSEFSVKQNALYADLLRLKSGMYTGLIRLTVRRGEHLFNDSYNETNRQHMSQFKYCSLGIYFTDFAIDDLGGPRREWFSMMSNEFVNPTRGLFIAPGEDKSRFYPNPAAGTINSQFLGHFRFAGIFIGKAIVEKCMVDCRFHRAFFKLILNKPVDFEDLKTVDPQYAHSLQQILDNDVTDFGMSFDGEVNGKIVNFDPRGRSINVTEANKHEYVRRLTEIKLKLSIKPHLDKFLEGLHLIIPASSLSRFTAKELEFLICGKQDYDVADLKANTAYIGYTATSQVITWFWQCVETFNAEERASLLQFATGSRGAPPGGFAQLMGGYSTPQMFTISMSHEKVTSLPRAGTCFNRIDLPQYVSFDDLKRKLLQAINYAPVGLLL